MSLAPTDLPRRHRLSVSDYCRMAEVGILAPDARVELIEGDIIDMSPSGIQHTATVILLSHVLFRAAGNRAFLLVQNSVRLGEISQPQPDITLLRRRDDFYREHLPRASDILLIVEVADTSLRFDRDTKVSLYAAHGVPEMWLVDLRSRRLIRHRAPVQGTYTVVDDPDLSVPLDVSALPGIAVELQQLFGN